MRSMSLDKTLILKFIDRIQLDLEFIVSNLHLLGIKENRFLNLLQNAWYEVLPSFSVIKNEIRISNFEISETAGLVSYQLLLKYEIFSYESDRLRSLQKNPNEIKFIYINNLLSAINNFLEDLAKPCVQAAIICSFSKSLANIFLNHQPSD